MNMMKILDCATVQRSEILNREYSQASPEIEATVAGILEDVAQRGDEALREYTLRFDGADLEDLKVSQGELDAALAAVDPALLAAIQQAAENIRAFHSAQLRQGFELTPAAGVRLGQRVIPLERVGLYVPGGTARYPSTVLMDAIPAQLAGCSQIVMVTPPDKDGSIPAPVLATAKRQVFGRVDIDMVAGPSEILVVADGSANPKVVAADLLSQAEHDKMATAVLVCDDMGFAQQVAAEVERQVALLPRAEIARASIDNNGKIIVAADLMEAIDIANEIAPEHLELCVEDPDRYLDQVRNAGCVFMGNSTPEALGDYWAGPNHTLPTLGTARFSSPLSVDDFIKKSNYIQYSPQALEQAAAGIMTLARSEGLEAHARSVGVRAGEGY